MEDDSTQKRRVGCAEEDAYLNILRTAEALSWAVGDVIKQQADLTPTQYNALRILRGAGPEGISCREVGERMITKESDITRLLDRIESRGLIERQRGRDRRYLVVRITDEGLRLVASLDKPVAEMHRRQLGHLGEKKLAALCNLLQEARQAVS